MSWLVICKQQTLQIYRLAEKVSKQCRTRHHHYKVYHLSRICPFVADSDSYFVAFKAQTARWPYLNISSSIRLFHSNHAMEDIRMAHVCTANISIHKAS